MRSLRTAILAVLCITLADGCASAPKPSAQQIVTDRESAALTPSINRAKTRYKGVVMGSDIQANTLVISVDSEGLSQMDYDKEDALIAGLLDDWKRAWSANHHGKHAKLALKFQNYYGQA
ncbi:MAG: hypothetical protein M3Y21_12005, partial [Candidatus Eremiobacteraeota bacterium]|nr:hypothetical protein [Candidatus Eremiobacteraeota bacterium]